MKNLFYLLLLSMVASAISVSAQPTQWTSYGIGGGDALFHPSINPTNSNIVYVSSDASSVFQTANLGDSWSTVDFRALQGGSFTGKIQYTNDANILYGLNNNYDFFAVPSKSTNGGVDWEPLATDPTDGEAYSLYSDYNNPNNLIVSDYSSIFMSTDGGQTFALKYGGPTSPACHVAGVFFDGNAIYIGTNLGMVVSMNGGSAFSIVNYTGFGTGEAMVSFSGTRQSGTVRLYCTTINSINIYPGITGAEYASFTGVYTLDIGQPSWVYKISGISTSDYPFYVATSSTNKDIAYLAGGNEFGTPIVYKTTTAGATWSQVFNTTNNTNMSTGWEGQNGDYDWTLSSYVTGIDVSKIDATASKIVITDQNGVYFSSTGGSAWKQGYVNATSQNPTGTLTPLKKSYKGVGLENSKCWNLAWADSLKVIAGLSEFSSISSTDGGKSWAYNALNTYGSTVYYTLKHPAAPVVFAATSTINDIYEPAVLTDDKIEILNGKILVSADAGKNWTVLHDFLRPVVWMATDPNNPNRLFASVVSSAFGGIYVSNDIDKAGASSWTRLSAPPRTEGHTLSIQVLRDGSLVCSYSARKAGSPLKFTESSGVFISTDNGASWQDRSDPAMRYWTRDLVVDPQDPTQNTWYASVYSGYDADAIKKGDGGLYKTQDRGITWKKIAILDRVNSCTVNPLVPDEMYVTTESDGLWYTSNLSDETPTFSEVFDYPFREPERVFFNPYKTNEVWVTSYGNGVRVATGVQPVAPVEPILISPENDTVDAPLTRYVFWNGSAVATKYRVQISTKPDFTALIKDTVVTTPYYKYFGLAETTTYYWRVAASNIVGTSIWSEEWNFTTLKNPQIPDKPVLFSPSNDSTKVMESSALVWNSAVGADKYRVQLSQVSTFASTIIDQADIKDTSTFFNGLALKTKYYWRVSATNTIGTSPWSDVWSFTTRDIEGVEENALPGIWIECTPNPLANDAVLSFSLVKSGQIRISIVSTLGREVTTVMNGWKSAGQYSLKVSLSIPQGSYFLRLQTEEGSLVKELQIIR
ncbi:MAG: T9SS type A sorting domain-containing protein [Ignavibacteriae bacterium]|nr:T9SS type A sorting domain-containing protein [Ignavibacteriota bacterium]